MNMTAGARMIIRSSPEKVFEAFSNPEQMSRFWFTRRDDGLKQGQAVTWYVGNGPDAPSIDVRVKELNRPSRLHIEWGQGGKFTDVIWTFEGTDEGDTVVQIEESDFELEGDSLIARVLDSTAGFNQVIVAAKAMLEHGKDINVVSDHA